MPGRVAVEIGFVFGFSWVARLRAGATAGIAFVFGFPRVTDIGGCGAAIDEAATDEGEALPASPVDAPAFAGVSVPLGDIGGGFSFGLALEAGVDSGVLPATSGLAAFFAWGDGPFGFGDG